MNNKQKYSLEGSTVLVTGGAGFIGSHLVEKLIHRKVKKIKILDNFHFGKMQNIPSSDNIEVINYNLGFDDLDILSGHLKNVDFLFHLAAEKHNQSKESPQNVIQSNITGTLHLFQAAAKNNIKKIIFTSSLYANGRTSKPPLKESDLPAPVTIYGISKLTGEHLLAYHNKIYETPYITLRLMFVYGPKQWGGTGYKSVIIKNFERLRDGLDPLVCGDGLQVLDYIYIDDVIEGLVQALESEKSGEIITLGSGQEITIDHLSDLQIKIAGRGEKKHIQADETAGTYRVGDISKAKKLLDFRPKTTLEEGLAKTFAWIKVNR